LQLAEPAAKPANRKRAAKKRSFLAALFYLNLNSSSKPSEHLPNIILLNLYHQRKKISELFRLTSKEYEMKKLISVIVVLAILLVGGYFIVLPQIASASSSSASTTYTTSAAALGNITTSVSGTGNVRPKQTTVIKWQTSGTIASVSVSKGDTVAPGAVLSSLDASTVPVSIISAQVDLSTAKKNLESILNNSQTRADAQAALVQAQIDLKTAQDNSASMEYQRVSQDTIDIAKASVMIAQDDLVKAQAAFDRVQKNQSGPDYKVNYANALSMLSSAKIKLQSAEYQVSYLEDLPNLKNVALVNAELAQAEATLASAQQAWDLVKNGADPDSVAAAQAKVAAAQLTVNQAEVTAPFSGTITDVYAETGTLVASATSAFQIEDLSKLLVDVSVSEVDITGVQLDQPATITFDAISSKTYNGKVTNIASSGTVSSGSVNFTVTVEITDPDEQIKSGMSASVDIVVNELTNVLVVPTSSLRTVGSNRVVYVLQNNQAVAVTVTLGASADTTSQVLTGSLKQGDLIILDPPSSTTTSSTTSSSSGLSGLFSGISNIFSGGSTTGGGPNGGTRPSGSPPSGAPSGSSGSSTSGSGSTTGGN